MRMHVYQWVSDTDPRPTKIATVSAGSESSCLREAQAVVTAAGGDELSVFDKGDEVWKTENGKFLVIQTWSNAQ